jgi:hypothetical protein
MEQLPPSPEEPVLDLAQLQQELFEVTGALKEHVASWPYAYAMAGGCHGGSEHPALRAVRDEVGRLRTRRGDLRAIIAEHTNPEQAVA